MVTLLALETPTHIVLFENSANGKYKLAMKRRVHPSLFKGKRAKIKTFNEFDPEYICLNQIYGTSEFHSILNSYLNKLKKDKESDTRSALPTSGDYLQLCQNGRLSEDFTFIHEMIADHEDGEYTVLDVYQHEYLVAANPDRDNGRRRAFKQILKGAK